MSRRAYANDHSRRRDTAESDHDPLAAMTPTAATAENAPTPLPAVAESPQPGHNFGQIAVQPAPTVPQMALRVSDPGDTHEREARDVAEQVMRMPEPAASAATETSAHSSPSAPAAAAQAIPDDGQPLDAATRAFMEPRFGHDFAKVRVHTDARAAESAASYSARAYTLGSDIVFGAGEYTPGTSDGQHLLAHELTHVVQQNGSAASPATIHREPVETSLPDTAPVLGKKVSPERMNDDELATGILHKLRGILDAWKTALGNFYVVLASSSDKETRPNLPGVILDFLREEAVGEIIKYVPLEMGRAYKLLTSLGTEDKRAQAAQDSAKLRDFVVSHASAIGDLLTAMENNWSDFRASVRLTAEAMNEGEQPKPKGKKGKWEVDTSTPATRVFDDYWMMHMALIDTYSALDAQVSYATSANLFRLLSEEWIRGSTMKEGWDTRHARIIVHLNKDFSVKDAHIEGTGGQKIAEQLVKDANKAHLEGVDVYHMRVRKEVQYFGDDGGYPSAYAYLDEENRIHGAVRGDEGTAAIWQHIRSNGAKALMAKKMDGD
jgi:Domain of unknown function (DUF4157)